MSNYAMEVKSTAAQLEQARIDAEGKEIIDVSEIQEQIQITKDQSGSHINVVTDM